MGRSTLMRKNNLKHWNNFQPWQGHVCKTTPAATDEFLAGKRDIISSFTMPSHICSHEKATAAIRSSLFALSNFTGLNSVHNVPFDCTEGAQPGASTPKRYLIFDQSGECTRLIFSSFHPQIQDANLVQHRNGSMFHPHRCVASPGQFASVNRSYETGAFNETKETPEKSDEIDALLCSEFSNSEHEEEFSNGCLLTKSIENNEEVVSSCMPVKKRRLCDDGNALLRNAMDTAKVRSAQFPCCTHRCLTEESYCTKQAGVEAGENCKKRKRMKDRILYTVSMLRLAIPGSEGKDIGDVLDKSIKYLRFLKLKAHVPVAAHIGKRNTYHPAM